MPPCDDIVVDSDGASSHCVRSEAVWWGMFSTSAVKRRRVLDRTMVLIRSSVGGF